MKWRLLAHRCQAQRVAPFTGAWIEMQSMRPRPRPRRVAPFTGAWIEIVRQKTYVELDASLSSRERGLKYLPNHAQPELRQSLPSWERGLK